MTTSPAEGAKRALPLSGATILPFPKPPARSLYASRLGFEVGLTVFHPSTGRIGTIIATDFIEDPIEAPTPKTRPSGSRGPSGSPASSPSPGLGLLHFTLCIVGFPSSALPEDIPCRDLIPAPDWNAPRERSPLPTL